MKKLLYGGFVALLLALCLVPSVGLLIAGPSQPGANEKLHEKPSLKTEAGGLNGAYLSDLAGWFGDHFFLRQELISVDRYLTANVLHTSGEPGVILGSDGWLYYADTRNDYTGTKTMTDRELFAAAKNLSLMASYCEASGKDFLFVIAPNKNSLYDDHMPDCGAAAQVTDADRLMAALETQGVNTADLFAAFRGEEEVLYFAHDSHWNSKGAALGADRINAALGVESNFYGGDFSRSVPHEGDLFDMLYPAFTDPERDPVYGGALSYTVTSKSTRPDAIVLTTECDKPGTLLVYRDSFGNLLYPYLAASFGSVRFSRATAYDLTLETDHVVVELVERNLRYLVSNLPVMPSPQRELELPRTAAGSIPMEIGSRGEYTQVTGTLPKVDDASPVYVVCEDAVYEAFCLENNRFGVNLPEGSTAKAVVCTVGGQMILYTMEK